jgi:hypothetical protein
MATIIIAGGEGRDGDESGWGGQLVSNTWDKPALWYAKRVMGHRPATAANYDTLDEITCDNSGPAS